MIRSNPHQTSSRLMGSTALSLLTLAMPGLQSAQAAEAQLPTVEVRANQEGHTDNYAPALTELGSKTPTAIRDIPQSLSVISKDVMTSQGVTSLTEALSNVPGITLSAGEGGNIGDNINLRGYSARSDLFVDGMRDRGQYARDTFFVESVEVLKGPSSMQFGRGSTGGVINRTTKKANLKSAREAAITLGTEDNYRSTLDVNQAIAEKAAFRISLMADSRGSDRDQIESESYGIAPTIRFGIGSGTEYSLSAVLQKSQSVPDYGLPIVNNQIVPVNRDTFYGLTDDSFNTESNLLQFGFKHRYSDQVVLNNRLQYSEAKTDASPSTTPLYYYPNGDMKVTPLEVTAKAPLPAGTPLEWILIKHNRRDREINEKSLYNQTDLNIKFNTAGLKHELSTGVEIGHDDYENQAYTWTNLPLTPVLNPVYEATPLSSVRNQDQLTDSGADSFSAYINDQLALSAQWKLIAGLRWERFKAHGQQTTSAGAVTELRNDNRMFSQRFGALYQPDDSQSYYVSYGTSFNPSAENMTLTVANQSVDPEKSISNEIGAKWDLLEGNLSLTTALYQVRKQDARTTDPITTAVTLDGNNRVRGFELGVAGKLSDVWQVMGGYSRMNSKITAAKEANTQDKELANTPHNMFSLWSTYQPIPHWELGGGLVYSSDRFVNNTNLVSIDGYTRYDATLAYRQTAYDVRLNLKNLSDEEYFEVASNGRATPAANRSAQLSLIYRF